ncbi:hypothetical protein L596_023441 [Steinernema carpocapsae]|uniref:RNA-binding protein 15B n=1 Tax=Steinernema carpocapsae TaxID=34508 RepID=A0A4U5MDW2_STECR|nr:hypothetical protein L596_023441 [Steinernema carpocapsae]
MSTSSSAKSSSPRSRSSSRSSGRSRKRSRTPVGKRISRRPPDPTLSAFYKDRFGSHSPEEYRNLRFSQFDEHLTSKDIRETLDHEFEKRFGPYEIKVIRNPDDEHQKLAYVNFEKTDAAKKIRQTMLPTLQRLFGRRLFVDPAGVVRDQGGNYLRDRYHTFNSANARRDPSPRRNQRNRSSPSVARRRRDSASGGGWRHLKKDDAQATRTLFVGNLPLDIRESEIQKVFEKYGAVEDVDIKTPADAKACYAFVLFANVQEAIEAKANEQDEPIRTGAPFCKIGYGKSQATNRLWIGGLGDWTSASALMKEFDRYGVVDYMDYNEGDSYGYIRFQEIASSVDACREMKNFPLGGKDRCILVDFATDEPKSRKRRASSSPDGKKGSSPKQRRGPQTPPDSPIPTSRSSSTTPEPPVPLEHEKEEPEEGELVCEKRLRSPSTHEAETISKSPTPEVQIKTVEELEEEIASTWKGIVQLKKRDYVVRLFRIAGSEHILQRTLRDENGASLQLQVSQRLTLGTVFPTRLEKYSPKQYTIMIATFGKADTSLQPLVAYLTTKKVIGIVQLEDFAGYVIPPSETAEDILEKKPLEPTIPGARKKRKWKKRKWKKALVSVHHIHMSHILVTRSHLAACVVFCSVQNYKGDRRPRGLRQRPLQSLRRTSRSMGRRGADPRRRRGLRPRHGASQGPLLDLERVSEEAFVYRGNIMVTTGTEGFGHVDGSARSPWVRKPSGTLTRSSPPASDTSPRTLPSTA